MARISQDDAFLDFDVEIGSDGIFDIGLDAADADVAVTQSLYPAVVVSLFSDRRARADEIADPMERRGWIGDLVSDVPGDMIGSVLWFFKQSRLNADTASRIEAASRNALQWMVDDGLCNTVTAKVVSDPAARTSNLNVVLGLANNSTLPFSFVLAAAGRPGLLIYTSF